MLGVHMYVRIDDAQVDVLGDEQCPTFFVDDIPTLYRCDLPYRTYPQVHVPALTLRLQHNSS